MATYTKYYSNCSSAIPCDIGIISVGMFEANAIQFGMDQMFEASSKQLSSFICWYFWCAHIGATLMIYLMIGACLYGFNCKVNNIHFNTIFDNLIVFFCWIAILSSCIQLPVSIIGIIACVYYKRKFPIEQASRKPLRLIYNVLKYSYNHKQPERRSALTYWESDIPSRIDLGKHKYGGPFTYEQVDSFQVIATNGEFVWFPSIRRWLFSVNIHNEHCWMPNS